jgi:16S rRNA (adenine1518-N6/adenine1519-N6)-dimethyltransferase
MNTKQSEPRPKKRLGQHFLTDKNIIAKILKAADLQAGERVLEIGPGRGALTTALLGAGAQVVAIEFDSRLIGLLKKKFEPSGRFRLVQADAVKIPFEDVLEGGEKVKVVANLPYNISGPILAKFTEKRALFSSMTLMLQKEVADRLLAEPSTKDYGALTVVVTAFMTVRRAFNVAPACFTPAPKVDSTVITMTPREKPLVLPVMEAAFKRVVKGAFLQRRKTLRNSLKGAGFEPEDLDRTFEATGITPTCRGETLTVVEFVRLTKALVGG